MPRIFCSIFRPLGPALVLLAGVACSSTQTPTPPMAPAGEDARARTQSLDRLIEELWSQKGVTPSAPADDGEFLRRVTLDLAGRVPTLAETHAFLSDPSPDHRARLVDRLLASPELAEHFADLYSDLLWRTDGSKRLEKQDPRAWLVTAFNENRPYDRLATDLITATGDLRDNRATAFIAARERGGGGPEALAGASARLFLGLQIQCAQCHDHPYDKRWKQRDFYGLVAYFARTKVKRSPKMDGEGASFTVLDQRRGEAKMHPPHSEEEILVAPRFLGAAPTERAGESRRPTLAHAVVTSDLFAKAMVGRTWTQLFGSGIVEPWDDLGAENDPEHPALLVALADDFRESGYDIKALLRRVVLSTAYARSSAPPPGLADDGGAAVRAFARARVRPLTPEQLFHTLLTATGADRMARHRQADDRVDKMLANGLREYRFAFDDDEMADTDFDGSMPQALLLLNGEITNNGTRAGDDGVLGAILAETREPAARLDQMFLAIYARRPSADERSLMLASLAAAGRDPRKAYEDMYFALLTSTEAMTNH